ncbi:unnamed protein product, partial [Effrenium voratum]
GECPSRSGGDTGTSTSSIPARKSSKMLRGNSNIGEFQQAMPMMQQFMNMMQAMALQQHGAAGLQSLNNLQVFKNNRQNKSLALPVPVQAGSSAPDPAPAEPQQPEKPEAMAPLKQDNVSRGSSQSLFDLDVITPSKQGNMRAEQQYQVMSAAYSRRAAEKPAEDPEAERDTAPVTPPKEGEGTFFWKGGKIHRLHSLGRGKCVSQSALAATLEEVANLPELPAARYPLAPTTAGGKEELFEFTFVNPLAWMYHLCATCTQYADLVKNMFQTQGVVIMLPGSERKIIFGKLGVLLGDEGGPLAAMPGMAVGCGL